MVTGYYSILGCMYACVVNLSVYIQYMSISIHMYVYACLCICTICLCIRENMYVLHACLCICTICIRIRAKMCHVCICMSMYVVCTCMGIYTCVVLTSLSELNPSRHLSIGSPQNQCGFPWHRLSLDTSIIMYLYSPI